MGNPTFDNSSLRPFLLAVLTALATACGGESGTSPAEVTLSLTPSNLSLFVGGTGQLNAVVSGAPGATVSFTSQGTGVATVDSNGLVTGRGLGNTMIIATVVGEGVSATASIAVNPSSITVSPTEAVVEVGETTQLTAQVTGGVGLSVSWSSTDEEVATVDGNGLVTGVAGGTAEVTASVDGQPGIEASADIAVTAPPEVLDVVITDGQGAPADLDDVKDVLVFDFEVEGAVGETARIDLLVDGDVVASEEFTFEQPAAVSGGVRREEITQQVPISVSVLEIEEMDDEYFEKIVPGLRQVTGNLVYGSRSAPIMIGGGTTTVSFTANPNPVFLVTGAQATGTVITNPSGLPVTDGIINLRSHPSSIRWWNG